MTQGILPRVPGLFIGLLVAVLAGSVGIIGYFGLGPRLIQPVAPGRLEPSAHLPDVMDIMPPASAAADPAIDPATRQAILSRVGAKVALPADETPQIQVITELQSLSGQPFFKQAQLADVVLVYARAGLVILYRPTPDQVIQTGTLTKQASSSAQP